MIVSPGPRAKRVIAALAALAVLALVVRFFYHRATHVYMDDARVDGNVVTISSPQLGSLVNTVNLCDRIAPWTFGLQAFFTNLAARGLLPGR